MNSATSKGVPFDTLPFSAPKIPQNSPFSSHLREVLGVLVSYVLAYLYICLWTFTSKPSTVACFLLFAAGFTLWGLWYHRDTPASRESWFWLVCLWVCVLSCSVGDCYFQRNAVWGDWTWLFAHCFAVYWLLARSGRLTLGGSSHFLPVDGVCGMILFPFRHFFLRLRALWWDLTHRTAHASANVRRFGFSLLAAGAAAVLFYGIVQLLAASDDRFCALLGELVGLIRLERLSIYGVRFLLSLPVGAYLCGLVIGTKRETPASLARRSQSISRFLTFLRKVPAMVWTVLLGGFVVLYLFFFLVQGTYLFGAFFRAAPQLGYTLSQYARKGFFELCQVMALNFGLLWLVQFCGELPLRKTRSGQIMATLLLSESILLAVTAASKLGLYLLTYGFTPLRIQSIWLIAVLLAACVAALVGLWTGKNTCRGWIFFTASTLLITLLIF